MILCYAHNSKKSGKSLFNVCFEDGKEEEKPRKRMFVSECGKSVMCALYIDPLTAVVHRRVFNEARLRNRKTFSTRVGKR